MATARLTSEFKLASKFLDGIETLTFHEHSFAYIICRSDIRIQRRIFQILIECIWVFADWYDNQQWSNDEGMNLYADAKRMQDILMKYGYTSKGDRNVHH